MNKPLFVFEIANNHQGNITHGQKIIDEIRSVCNDFPEFDYAFKFQYRDLDTFIHPAYKARTDIKNVKRFQDTRLNTEQFSVLLDYVKQNNFIAICTPFDEISVDLIVKQKYDYIKIASCSFDDWPLLEKIAETKMSVIASGAGSDETTLDRVINFFLNRNIDISLMHCVAEYPTPTSDLELNQIDYYKKKYPAIRIGFSTHEEPDNMLPVKLAIAKGAQIFEKHVGVSTSDITLNSYSANPNQVREWLSSAREAYSACGVFNKRYISSEKEQSDLAALKRGVFLKRNVEPGHVINQSDYFLAFPCKSGQLVASELSKYNKITYIGSTPLPANSALMISDVSITNTSHDTYNEIKKILEMLKKSSVVVPAGSSCEISHHYGLSEYERIGVAMIDCINREYCKKILVVLPNQAHPSHYHVQKEETFVILHGDLSINLDGKTRHLKKGDVMTIERNAKHSFSSTDGCVFEEISTTHYFNDSFYENQDDFVTPRKTVVHLTTEMINEINS